MIERLRLHRGGDPTNCLQEALRQRGGLGEWAVAALVPPDRDKKRGGSWGKQSRPLNAADHGVTDRSGPSRGVERRYSVFSTSKTALGSCRLRVKYLSTRRPVAGAKLIDLCRAI